MRKTQTLQQVKEAKNLSKNLLDELFEIKDEENLLNIGETKALKESQSKAMGLFEGLFKLSSKLELNKLKEERKNQQEKGKNPTKKKEKIS